ncbi:MAG TPA: hypothetical protein VMH04_04155 [Candidatus Solibacter sp.]|nr:hypothetical protein [Candidatus Solibacter sp.]
MRIKDEAISQSELLKETSPEVVKSSRGLARRTVIRLSTSPIATDSREMTQQERIAAALARAGIATPWESPDVGTADASPKKDALPPADSTTPSSGH